jgi:uncharacterized protein YdaU (DUF1376 family)
MYKESVLEVNKTIVRPAKFNGSAQPSDAPPTKKSTARRENLPYMPFFVGDYLKETGHLKAEEHGVYLLLIMHYWVKGSLPNDDEQLARIGKVTPSKWKNMREIINAFFYDGWHHESLDEQLAKAAAKVEQTRLAATSRWQGKKL